MYAIEFETSITSPFIHLQNYEQFMNQQVKVIVLSEEKSIQTDSKPRYDFSDVSGKLAWSGDAVAEQKALRNEW